jgi:hypothetical protein
MDIHINFFLFLLSHLAILVAEISPRAYNARALFLEPHAQSFCFWTDAYVWSSLRQ